MCKLRGPPWRDTLTVPTGSGRGVRETRGAAASSVNPLQRRRADPFPGSMTPRAVLVAAAALLLLPSCAALQDVPETPRGARWCAEEHPLNTGDRRACERARGVTAARQRPAPRVVYVTTEEDAGQGMVDYGRQLSARPIRCTSTGLGTFVRTVCR